MLEKLHEAEFGNDNDEKLHEAEFGNDNDDNGKNGKVEMQYRSGEIKQEQVKMENMYIFQNIIKMQPKME